MKPEILTVTGDYFNFLQPRLRALSIVDIARALSRICRFTGHTTEFYSVAQHSVFVSHLVPKEHALAALLHDASEAYLGDVSSPLKQLLPDYRAIEAGVEREIAAEFGFHYPLHPCIKDADLCMLATERRDLMPKALDSRRDEAAWFGLRDYAPLNGRITAWDSNTAYDHFTKRFWALYSHKAET
jgi:hypothetical protein